MAGLSKSLHYFWSHLHVLLRKEKIERPVAAPRLASRLTRKMRTDKNKSERLPEQVCQFQIQLDLWYQPFLGGDLHKHNCYFLLLQRRFYQEIWSEIFNEVISVKIMAHNQGPKALVGSSVKVSDQDFALSKQIMAITGLKWSWIGILCIWYGTLKTSEIFIKAIWTCYSLSRT